ncbi:hypothetical protein AcV5_009595 [Taiwanofungus camphoratus]|nr:hypothetical protein AcV5_009595 [Antrodia cinnamomea]KAI0942976.1 hypothetical protein AcV7_002248 [Antrodia cinnamomea]
MPAPTPPMPYYCPPSTSRKDYRGQAAQRSPLMPLSANGGSWSSQQKPLTGQDTTRMSRRPPPSPIKLDAGVDRFTIRPHSTVRSRSSPPHSSGVQQPRTPRTPRSPPVPLPNIASSSSAVIGSTRVPSKSFSGQTPFAPYAAPSQSSTSTRPQPVQRPQIGPFEFLRVLPKGTFGKTFVSRDLGTGRVLCTRVFQKAKTRNDSGFFDGLLTELLCYKLIAAQPPNRRAFLMEMHAVLQDEESLIFAMPLMQCDLLSVIRGRGNTCRTRRWVAQMALGIDALHSVGIIHRDIKPENMLYDARTDTVRIADFNAAYLDSGNAPLETRAVYSREYIGSKPYMAQEIVRRQWYGKMVDWWSLGCLMFDLITGELLFRNELQRTKYVNWDTQKEGYSYLSWAARLSDEEEDILAGLLHLNPLSRFQLEQLRSHPYFVDENGYLHPLLMSRACHSRTDHFRVNVFGALMQCVSMGKLTPDLWDLFLMHCLLLRSTTS